MRPAASRGNPGTPLVSSFLVPQDRGVRANEGVAGGERGKRCVEHQAFELCCAAGFGAAIVTNSGRVLRLPQYGQLGDGDYLSGLTWDLMAPEAGGRHTQSQES